MSDKILVERLREADDGSHLCGEWNANPDDLREAADTIERLEAENARLREALTRITWVLDEGHGAMAGQAYRYARAALGRE